MNRDFKGIWIPKTLWESTDLSVSAKVILLEIDSLSTDEKGCYAKNSHFAGILRVVNGTVENIIGSLKEDGWITVSDILGKRHISLTHFAHEKMGSIMPSPRKNGLEAVFAHEKMGSIVSNTEENNTEEVERPKAIQKQAEPLDGKVDWNSAKSDLQRFMGSYLKMCMPAIYKEADKKQVGGFFRQYGKMFSGMLNTAGTLDVAVSALYECEKYYKKLGYPWGLKAMNGNWGEFVNAVMEQKRRI